MDFTAGLVDIFVTTKLVYVATLQLNCVFRLCCGFVATFLTCLQFIAIESFFATKFLNVAVYL